VDDQLKRLRGLEVAGPFVELALPNKPTFATRLSPPVAWSLDLVERRLGVSIPDDVGDFWAAIGGARLVEDASFGQWGLVLWSPEETVERSPMEVRSRDQYRPGDLIVGEFLGDSDLVLIRSNSTLPDYGSVLIVEPIYARSAWSEVGRSFAEFLGRYVDARGDKFWERPAHGSS